MSVKIRVSYETKQELDTVLELLKPIVKTYKAEKGEEKPYKKAYIELNI